MILICTDPFIAEALADARTHFVPMGDASARLRRLPWNERQFQCAHLAAVRREDGLYDVIKCRHSAPKSPVTLAQLRALCDQALEIGDGMAAAAASEAPAEPFGRRFDLDDGPGRAGPAAPPGENIENGAAPAPAQSLAEGPAAPAVRGGGRSASEVDAEIRRRTREARLELNHLWADLSRLADDVARAPLDGEAEHPMTGVQPSANPAWRAADEGFQAAQAEREGLVATFAPGDQVLFVNHAHGVTYGRMVVLSAGPDEVTAYGRDVNRAAKFWPDGRAKWSDDYRIQHL